MPSLETSESQPFPEIRHFLSLEPSNQANHSDHSPDYPSDLLCSDPNYSLSAETPSSLQDFSSAQCTRHTDVKDSWKTPSHEFSAASNHERKDSLSNAAFLYEVDSTDFIDSPVAQYSEPSASQLRNNSNRAEFARAENLDSGGKETTSPPLPVRKQGPLSCPDCGKNYSHRHQLK